MVSSVFLPFGVIISVLAIASTETTLPKICRLFSPFTLQTGAAFEVFVVVVVVVLVESAAKAKLHATRPAIRAWYNFIKTSRKMGGN
jgi:hypothetical protein